MDESKEPQSRPQEENEKLNIKVLLADDDPSVLNISRRVLEGMGCTVVIAKTGEELLEKLEEGGYDLIVTDNTMFVDPTKPLMERVEAMSGIQALKIIRADDRFKHLPVIVNTGDHYVKEEIEQLGGTYLGKPFSKQEFEETVRRVVEKSALSKNNS